MNYDYYEAASEATDADERALIPGFKRIRPVDREAQRDAWDAEHEAKEPDAFADFIEALDQLELANERNQ